MKCFERQNHSSMPIQNPSHDVTLINENILFDTNLPDPPEDLLNFLEENTSITLTTLTPKQKIDNQLSEHRLNMHDSYKNNKSEADKVRNINAVIHADKAIPKQHNKDDILTSRQTKSHIDKAKANVIKKSKTNNQKQVIVCGDSILNGIHGAGISSKAINTVVRCFPGAISEYLKDFIKPFVEKKPDALILHIGTNDLVKNNIDTIQNLTNIIDFVREQSKDTNIVISETCVRGDKPNMYDLVCSMNNKLVELSITKGVGIIKHPNIDKTCLSRKQLHLNQKPLIASHMICLLLKWRLMVSD